MAFWNAVERLLSFPSSGERRYADLGTTPLSGVTSESDIYKALVSALDGVSSGGGISGLPSVGMDRAGTNSALYRALAMKCSTIAAMPLQVFEKGEGGRRTQVEPEEDRWIWSFPNQEETPMEFWETLLAQHELAGDAFIYCVRSRLGNIAEAFAVHPHRIQVGRDPVTRRKIYLLDGDTEMPMADARPNDGEIIHVRNLAWSRKGLRGFGLIDLARTALGLASAGEEYGARFLANGGQIGRAHV